MEKETVIGTYSRSTKFGFIIPDNRGKYPKDFFVTHSNAKNARDGDRVKAIILGQTKGAKNIEAQIIEFVERKKLKIKGKIGKMEVNQIKGIFSQVERGDFGFIDTEEREKGYFVYSKNKLTALDGDEVLAEVKSFNGREEAVVLKITKRTDKNFVGIYRANEGKKFGFVILADTKLRSDIFIPGVKSMEASTDDVVVARIENWSGKNPTGKIIQIIGSKSEKGVDILSLAAENGARIDFSETLLKSVENLPEQPEESDINLRKNLQNDFTITIDGPDAKDLDDAISIRQKTNGNYILQVHIADVSHYVQENSLLDKEAKERTTSIYLLDRVIPMLPKKLSNGLCSLNPNVPRLTLTCEMELNPKGEIIKTTVFESVINSDYRMTYDEVRDIIQSKKHEDKKLSSTLLLADKLRKVLEYKKRGIGVINFDFTESKIILDEEGKVEKIQKYKRHFAHKIIEEFMILANEAIGKKFSKIPFLYRVHPKPSSESLEKLRNILHVFGYSLPYKEITSKDISSILTKAKNDPKEKVISKSLLRSLSKAIYTSENEGHFGLALDFYSHFTSPIRRYPDLQIHRIIKQQINNQLSQDKINNYKSSLAKIADNCSLGEQKAEKLEYAVQDLKKAEYMNERIGQEYTGIISGMIPAGFFVELDNSIEGFVRIDDIHGDRFEYSEEDLSFSSHKTGLKLSFGEEVKISVKKSDIQTRKIDFELII